MLPNTVKTLKKCAFHNCTNLKRLYIPKSVKAISDELFYSNYARIDEESTDTVNLVIYVEKDSYAEKYCKEKGYKYQYYVSYILCLFKQRIYLKTKGEKCMNKGKLITFCGLDGCGKTTMITKLEKDLKKNGHKVFVTKQPTDDVRSSEIFRTFMYNPDNSKYVIVRSGKYIG